MTRPSSKRRRATNVTIDLLSEFGSADLHDLCDAAEAAIDEGGGFGWLEPPARQIMETYWSGVLVVPGRTLYVARLDGVICGSAQLVRPPRNNEAQAHMAVLQHSFVAPWARGHGVARLLTSAVEHGATKDGFRVLQLDVRETQLAAIALYESMGFECWGTNPHHAWADGCYVAGRYYSKRLALKDMRT